MTTSLDVRNMLWGQAFGSTHIPKGVDLADKTIIVTGANTGLGFECAKHLLQLKVNRLILACRNLKKGIEAKESLLRNKANQNTTIDVWEVDLASYTSVLAFSKRVRTSLPRLDAFIANAGVEMMEYTTAEGLETSITVNVISNFLLNIGVLPKLRETSVKYGQPTTLTVVGSSVYIFGADKLAALSASSGVDIFEAVSDPNTAEMRLPGHEMSPQYGLTKTLIHALGPQLACRASRSGRNEGQVVVNWVNPGWCSSELSRHKEPKKWKDWLMFSIIGRTAEQGSRTLVHAALAGPDTHGCLLSECRTQRQANFLCNEEGVAIQKRLWRELMARVAKISPETAAFVE